MPKELFDRLQKKRVPVDIGILESLDYESGLRLAARRVAHKYALKMAPVPGVQTVVTDKSQKNLPTDIDREKQVVLPPGSATPGGEGRMISQFSYNTPDADSDIKPRTLGLPGEQYGHPSNDTYNTVSRRTMTATPHPRVNQVLRRMAREAIEVAGVEYPDWYFVSQGSLTSTPDYGRSDAALPRGAEGEGIVVPDEEGDEGTTKTAYKRRWQKGKRQRKSRGTSRTKRKQYNRRNKQKRKMQSRKWRKKNKNNSAFKRGEKRRRSQNRKRRTAHVLTVPDIAFIIGPEQMLGYVHSISPLSGMVTIELDETNVSQLDSLPVEVFLRMAVFLTEQDIEAFYDLVDVEIGPSAYEDLDEDLVRDCAKRYDRDPDADDFKDDCFALTDEYELSSMSPDQLESVTSGVIQGFIEEGHARSVSDADNPEIGDEYDPHLYYGEVDVER